MIIKKKRSDDNNEKKLKESASKDVELGINDQIDFDNIKFESRAERRQGSRRRGYRRIDDRNLISRAQEEAISIKEMAAKEGHKIGIESAKEDILKLNHSIQDFFLYKEELYKKISDGVLDISVEIARKIVNTEISTNKEILLNIINKVLIDSAKGENRITIKVKSEDVEYVKQHLPEILSNTQFEAKIIVISDDNIQQGGAVIETTNGIIDATIETQVEIITKAFREA